MFPAVVGVLTCCALLHSIVLHHLDVQPSLIWEFIYKFELSHNAGVATKKIWLKS